MEQAYLVVLIKWSKTIQKSTQGTYIIIPRLANSLLCPYQAFLSMCKSQPASKNSPLFQIKNSPLTQSQVRRHLTKVLRYIGIDTNIHSFHAFRRSGATLAYNLDVNMQNIKRHGTWQSDSVYDYIVTDPTHAAGVATSFQLHFKKHSFSL